jgi:hypothetical protein
MCRPQFDALHHLRRGPASVLDHATSRVEY